MVRASLVAFTLLVHCGARTDLGGAQHVDASADASCAATVVPTKCAQPLCGNDGCIAKVSQQPTGGFALDAVHVFWSVSTAVMRADKCGANATLLVGCLGEVGIMGLSADDVYFKTLVFNNDTPHETLFRVSKKGGAPVTLASYDTDIQALDVDGDALFFTLASQSSQQGRLVRMPTTGGAETTLFTGNVGSGLAVDAGEVFFESDRNLMRMKEDGSTLTKMADMTLGGIGWSNRGIVLDAADVYSTSGCGDVQRVARNASNTKPELLGMVSQANGSICSSAGKSIAVDDDFVYLAYVGNGATPRSILRVSKAGGSFDTVLAIDNDPFALAVDASGVFWADTTSLQVRTTK